jgi:hypothetical protein
MKTVFEPSNSLEGYMLQDLLKQRGIDSRLDGAHLQGGVGELPASGLVRLVVSEEDFTAARAVIDDWESAHVTDPIPAPARRVSTGFAGALAGLLVGIAAAYAYFRVPAPNEGIDHDGDGSMDERWFVSAAGTMIRTESDRDFDGKADIIYRYDRQGRLDAAVSDDDFDGSFETKWNYIRGNATYAEVDSDGDSSPDLILRLKNGVLESTEYLVPGSVEPVRKEYFELNRLTSAEVDSDRDGRLDTRYTYSPLGEIVETRLLGPLF